MGSKEPIELLFVVSVKVVSVPPEPIAAFCGIKFVPGGLRAIRGVRGSNFDETGSSLTDQSPSLIVFLVADPDLIVLIDPGARMEVADSPSGRRGFERFGDGSGGGGITFVIGCGGRA